MCVYLYINLCIFVTRVFAHLCTCLCIIRFMFAHTFSHIHNLGIHRFIEVCLYNTSYFSFEEKINSGTENLCV